jgi:hypothetical protein
MCLITEQKKPIKIRKDLIVYKRFRYGKDKESFKPWNYMLDFNYTLNILHEQQMTHDNIFESWTDATSAIKYPQDQAERYTHVHEGFHSAATLNRVKMLINVGCTAKCIIPKGSLIFKDKTGLIVSNQIKMIEIIES